MITPDLLEILCCPETHQKLELAPAEQIAGFNQKIAAGALNNRAGRAVTEKVDGALIRADGRFAYVIRQDIPVMLIDEAVAL